jgi:hypothetical protein
MTRASRWAARAAQATTGGALLLVLAGCGAPQMVALGAACAQDKDGSAVVVDGFVSAGSVVSCDNYSGDYRCGLDLWENPDASGARASIDLVVGGGANQIDEPPKDYTDADVKVHTDSSATVVVGDKVRATGDISVAPGGVCYVTVDKIEKL